MITAASSGRLLKAGSAGVTLLGGRRSVLGMFPVSPGHPAALSWCCARSEVLSAEPASEGGDVTTFCSSALVYLCVSWHPPTDSTFSLCGCPLSNRGLNQAPRITVAFSSLLKNLKKAGTCNASKTQPFIVKFSLIFVLAPCFLRSEFSL